MTLQKVWNTVSLIILGGIIGAVIMFFLPSFASAATADGVVIATGSKTGNYYKVGHRLAKTLGKGTVINSKGSVDNLDKLMAGEANIAIVQMDAYAWYANNNPEAETKIEIMGPLYEECVYLAVHVDGKVKTEDDLQDKGVTVAVGKKGSGTAVTWDYMRQLETGYKNAGVDFNGGVRTLGKLASKPDGQINAVLWVTKPRLDGKLASTVLKNDKLRFLDVNDKDLNDKYKPTGQPIYKFRSIETEKGFFNDKEVKTICVDAVLVADAEADESMLESVADIVMNYHSTLVKQ